MVDKVKQGKKNRASGAAFELRVRKDLEQKGWIVDKWTNNIEFNIEHQGNAACVDPDEVIVGKLHPARRKYLGPGRPMVIGTGFPDFICIRVHDLSSPQTYHVQFVECKSNGSLNKIEKQKCRWLIEQGYNVLIAEKTKVKNRIVIVYNDFVEKYG
jgi:hypothetical protein